MLSEILDKPEKWTRQANARDSHGGIVPVTHPEACCFCLKGAMRKASNLDQAPSLTSDPPADFVRMMQVAAEVVGELGGTVFKVNADEAKHYKGAAFRATSLTVTAYNDAEERTFADIQQVVAEIDRRLEGA